MSIRGELPNRFSMYVKTFLVVTVCSSVFVSPCVWAESSPVVKAMALNFSLQDLSGKQVSFEKFRGRAIVLNFWATWCPPCVAEMPALNRLSIAYKDKGVSVVGINIGEAPGKVRPFISKLGISFDILLDTEGVVENKYHIVGVPTTFFIDSEGRINDVTVGSTTYSVFEERVKGILQNHR